MLSTIAALLCVATFSRSVSARKCDRHTDCPTFLPFCYDGTCELCSECEHCWDGIDGTCGGCDKRRFPLDGVKCPPPRPKDDEKDPKYPKPKRDEYEEEEEEDFTLAEEEAYEEEYAMEMEEEEEEDRSRSRGRRDRPRDENEDEYDRPGPGNDNGPRPKGPKMSREEIMDAVREQLAEDGMTETPEELETNVDMIMAIQDGEDLEEEEDFPTDEEEEEDFTLEEEMEEEEQYFEQQEEEEYPMNDEAMEDMEEDFTLEEEEEYIAQEEEEEYADEFENYDPDSETAYGQSCEAHSDCPDLIPFCYETGDCAPCDECHYLSNGIDGTCGDCGDGYPTMEGNLDYVPECEFHEDCGGDEPFCYDGECAPCSECHYCDDGVDNTCGSCGDGYPTREEGPCDSEDEDEDDEEEYFDPASDEAERDYDDAEKRKYRKMIQAQLEAENDMETEEELDANVEIVTRLAKESEKKGKFSDRLADTFDVDIDNDIEMKVIDAIRKAKNENRMGLTERDIGNKLIEGLGQLAGQLLGDEEEEDFPMDDEDMEEMEEEREYDNDRGFRRRETKSDKEIEDEVIRDLKAEDDKRKRREKQEDREDLYE